MSDEEKSGKKFHLRCPVCYASTREAGYTARAQVCACGWAGEIKFMDAPFWTEMAESLDRDILAGKYSEAELRQMTPGSDADYDAMIERCTTRVRRRLESRRLALGMPEKPMPQAISPYCSRFRDLLWTEVEALINEQNQYLPIDLEHIDVDLDFRQGGDGGGTVSYSIRWTIADRPVEGDK